MKQPGHETEATAATATATFAKLINLSAPAPFHQGRWTVIQLYAELKSSLHQGQNSTTHDLSQKVWGTVSMTQHHRTKNPIVFHGTGSMSDMRYLYNQEIGVTCNLHWKTVLCCLVASYA